MTWNPLLAADENPATRPVSACYHQASRGDLGDTANLATLENAWTGICGLECERVNVYRDGLSIHIRRPMRAAKTKM